MIGYQTLTETGSLGTNIVVVFSGLLVVIALLNHYYHGYSAVPNWGKVPVVNWVKTANSWAQVLTYGKYSDYYTNDRYEYSWVSSESEMGFIMVDPPSNCTTLCSPGMRGAVDEIIAKLPKETYN